MEVDLKQLSLDGANAYRLGRNELDNPFYKADAMPLTTGESLEVWQQKAKAWTVGFQMERAIDNPDAKKISKIIEALESEVVK